MLTNTPVLMYEPSGGGGLFKYALYLCRALSRIGVKMIIETCRPYDLDGIMPAVEICPNLRPMAPRAGLLRFSPIWAADRFAIAFENARWRNQTAGEYGAEVVHIQLAVPWVDWWFMRELAKVRRVIYTVHDVQPHIIRRCMGMLEQRLRKRVLHGSDLLIVHTNGNKEQLVNAYGVEEHKIVVIPHATFPAMNRSMSKREARAELGLPIEKYILLFMGVIRANKGLDILLLALKTVVMTCSTNATLIVAGSMPPGEEFNDQYGRLIGELDLKDHVVMRLGWMYGRDMELYYKAADVLVLPYKTFASQSGILMSAYSYGCPVVASDVGGVGETLKEDQTGILVPAGDHERLAQGLLSMMEGVEVRRGFSEKMLNIVESKYSWDGVARQTREAYESVLNQ